MNLLKELSNKGALQQDLKTSDGSKAGATDVSSNSNDVKFSLMRNTINTDGQVTGSDVNDYLERAKDLNDEVESVGFAIETDNGDIIKVYVVATEADKFEEALAKLLGLEGDTEEAINQLAQEFDIVDVVWPQDPNDPDANLSIDDAADDIDDDEDLSRELNLDTAAAPANDVSDVDDILDASTDEAPKLDADATDDEFEDIPPADADADADPDTTDDEFEDIPPATDADNSDKEPVLNADGTQKLDKNGEPVMRKKKKEPEIKEEGLSLLSLVAESAREEIEKHISDIEARGNKGKYTITARVAGGITGLRISTLKRDGKVAYFDTEAEAAAEAAKLTKQMNRAGATASFSYTPKLVENK